MENTTLEYGIEWVEETVQKQHGDHATDRAVLNGKAQIPVVRDLAPFVAEFSEAAVLGSLDGTSIRVMAQDVNRRLLAKGEKPETIRAAIVNRLRGIRNAGARGGKTVNRYALPNGEFYTGTDLVEYQQLYTVALVDLGTPADVARTIGANQKF